MANHTMIFPFQLDLAEWLKDAGLTDQLPREESRPLTAQLVRRVLLEQDWPYSEGAHEHEGKPIIGFWPESRNNASPPFSEIELWPDFVSVRHGGYPAYITAKVGSLEFGPQVAFDEGGAGPALVRPSTTYEHFAQAFGYEADLERETAWTPAHKP